MIFLPIVSRELRVSSRKRATYWVRTAAVALVMAFGAWCYVVMQGEPQQTIATGLFSVLTGSAVLYALLSGLRTTADCLSEEKREGTLGLLFLTDLRGYDVVLGKLLASSINAFYSVVAILPMLAIPLLMGGITLGEFARMALLTVNSLFFSLCTGMLCSALSRSANRSALAAISVTLLLSAGLPAIGAFLALTNATRSVPIGFLLPSPGFTYYSAMEVVYRTNQVPFWISMALFHVLGWVFLILASAVSPHVWKDKPASIQRQRWTERWKLWSYGDLAERAEFRRRLLHANAFYWLASRARLKPALVWTFLAFVACCWIWGLAAHQRAWLDSSMYLMTGLFVNFVLRCWVASEATRQLAEDMKQGNLELLLSTPLSVTEILRGQGMALARQFFAPVIVVLGTECLFMVATVNAESGPDNSSFVFLYLAGMIMFVADLLAIYWVGMWHGLQSRNQSRATSTTLARILVLPWGLIAVVVLILAIASLGPRNGPGINGSTFLLLWFVMGIGIDVAFGLMARQQLKKQFRIAAQQRFAPKAGFWKRFQTTR